MAAHIYRTEGGVRVPGVTTVIGARQETGGLMWWANRLAYDPLMVARSHLDAARVAALQDKIPGRAIVEEWNDFLDISEETFDHHKAAQYAADAGTLAHAMVEAHILGGEPERELKGIEEGIADRAKNSFLAFLEWEEQTNLEVETSEMSLISEAHGFGGTLDAKVMNINGKDSIGDWKTSNGIYPDHVIQVAAYGMLWEENFPDRPINGGYHILRFSKDRGDFHHHYFQELSSEREQFLRLLAVYHTDKEIKKRVK